MNVYFSPQRKAESPPLPPSPSCGETKLYSPDCVCNNVKKFNLSEDEMNELKKNLLYFVKRLSQKGYNSPEEVPILPSIVELLLRGVK